MEPPRWFAPLALAFVILLSLISYVVLAEVLPDWGNGETNRGTNRTYAAGIIGGVIGMAILTPIILRMSRRNR